VEARTVIIVIWCDMRLRTYVRLKGNVCVVVVLTFIVSATGSF